MIDKETTIKYFKKVRSFAKVAKIIGSSRQRVHQIVNQYSTIYNYKRNSLVGDNCLYCNTDKKLNIHHIDCNPNNNNIFNLITLCTKCHKNIHVEIRKNRGGTYGNKKNCNICGVIFGPKVAHVGYGLCKECYNFKKYTEKHGPERAKIHAESIKIKSCMWCGISKDKLKFTRGVCKSCYQLYRYYKDDKLKEYYKKYYKSNF